MSKAVYRVIVATLTGLAWLVAQGITIPVILWLLAEGGMTTSSAQKLTHCWRARSLSAKRGLPSIGKGLAIDVDAAIA